MEHTRKSTIKNKTRKKRTFSKADYKSGDGMLTTVWGPSLWHYLHVMSFNYPIHPTQQDKQNYLQFEIWPCIIKTVNAVYLFLLTKK